MKAWWISPQSRWYQEVSLTTQVEREPADLIGVRRLGAREAVVFGDPHVESAQAVQSEVACYLWWYGIRDVSGYADPA